MTPEPCEDPSTSAFSTREGRYDIKTTNHRVPRDRERAFYRPGTVGFVEEKQGAKRGAIKRLSWIRGGLYQLFFNPFFVRGRLLRLFIIRVSCLAHWVVRPRVLLSQRLLFNNNSKSAVSNSSY